MKKTKKWAFLLALLLIVLIEYIPFFAGIGPGADLLFGSTFGGPFMSLLILFVPQVIVFSLISTYTYRRTGNVCTGAFVAAVLSCWIVTGGSAML
jgi:biotin transporter BioY